MILAATEAVWASVVAVAAAGEHVDVRGPCCCLLLWIKKFLLQGYQWLQTHNENGDFCDNLPLLTHTHTHKPVQPGSYRRESSKFVIDAEV